MTSTLKDTGCKPQAHGQAVPGGGKCPLCGRPRCTAAAKTRAGERCRKNPHPGASICTNHGLTAAGRAAAADRVAGEKAGKVIAELWPGLAGVAPVKDPIDLLARTAAALEAMADQVGERVNQLNGKVATGESMSQLRAEVVLLDRVLDKVIRASDRLASLGIAEKQVELEQARAEIVTQAYLASLAVVSLVPADRDAMLRAFLTGLGRGPEVLEAGGAA
jgi:hypothetical protein